jgi:hypothetical protein
MLTTHPLLAPRLRMSRAIPLLPLKALGGLLYGNLYLYMFRVLLAYPQEALHKRHLVYCVLKLVDI